MENEENSTGPNNLPQPPNLGSGPDLSGPQPPKLVTEEILNDLESEIFTELDAIDETLSLKNEEKKRIGRTIPIGNFIRRWKSKQRQIRSVLLTLMSYEMKTKVNISLTNELINENAIFMLKGQIEYFDQNMEIIKSGKDPISRKLMKKKKKNRASIQVFETLKEFVQDEIDRYELEKIEVKPLEYIEAELKRVKWVKAEPRATFWLLYIMGLMLKNIRSREEEAFDIGLDILMKYPPIHKRTLAVLLNFAYLLVEELPPYHIEDCWSNLRPNPTSTGYSMAHWLKYRYNTSSQYHIEYERFLSQYAKSFGKIHGRVLSERKEAYQNWIDRACKSLEERMMKSDLMIGKARGKSLEGMLIVMIDEMEEELAKREYDDLGKVINQPPGGDGALLFLKWIFEMALSRFNSIDMINQRDAKININIFDFMLNTIRWTNEHDERIVVDWLDLDNEEN